MCAIVDANVRDQVFGDAQSPAGKHFLDWLTPERGGRLIVGGRLLQELSGLQKFQRWLRVSIKLGVAKIIPDDRVNSETTNLENRGVCQSNDAHVVALAMIGGARLLFTNDRFLQGDFKQNIQDGKIYTTRLRDTVTSTHRRLLRQRCD